MPVQSSVAAGKQIANATMELLNDWNNTNCLAGMVFDETSCNTGHKTAALLKYMIWVGRITSGSMLTSCWRNRVDTCLR